MKGFREQNLFDHAYNHGVDSMQALLSRTLFKKKGFRSCRIETGEDLRALFLDDEDNRESLEDEWGYLPDGWDELDDEALYIVDPFFRLHGPCYSKGDLFSEALDLRYNSDVEAKLRRGAR